MSSSTDPSPPDSGSTRTAAVWAALEPILAAGPLRVLDVGGGTGGFAVPLAQRGHTVTVVDPSPDALALLARRADAAGVAAAVSGVQGDGDRLAEVVSADSADLVLCHHVLEFVDEPVSAAAALATCVRTEGWVSLLVANQAAAVLSRAVGGRPEEALALLHGQPDGTRHRRFGIGELHDLVGQAGLSVEVWHGVRVVADLLPTLEAGAEQSAVVRQLEAVLAQRSPYRDLATDLHLLCRR
ncbi:MAG: methyltransferase domain-containing protein [Actinomycetota bacterium]|jgi:SAM-dependent methyltransferase|nr:methyltransferase domain-containing protein [Geodermatophilaceae bacterium]MDQ3054283.1 methyltransferase domain-containing protein [Actinomycetota bacterium]